MIRRPAAMLVLALAACSKPPPPPPVLALTITGSAGQNPDASGAGTAVAVQLYQLGATGKFTATDVYSLMGNESGVLGADEVGPSEQFLLAPKQTLTESRPLKPGVTAVGFAVMFRDINHSTWRLTAPAAANGPTPVNLQISGLTAKLGK